MALAGGGQLGVGLRRGGRSLGRFTLIDGGVSSRRGAREFTRLYRESYPIVYNYVRIRMSDDSATEDVVSEAFLLAARFFDRFDPSRAKFSTWVVKIAINCMRGYWRKSRTTVAIDDLPESTFAVVDEHDALDDRELVTMLLKTLDDRERELVLMKYRDGKRNVEIAEEMGMNASTVSTVLSRAVARMREVYERSL